MFTKHIYSFLFQQNIVSKYYTNTTKNATNKVKLGIGTSSISKQLCIMTETNYGFKINISWYTDQNQL